MGSDLTPEKTARLVDYLDTHELSKGLGSKESACMVAAINLAIDGKLTDKIPACMSKVIGRWGIIIQDTMPATMRNSREFKSLIPLAAGTGRNLEKQRAAIALDWMWTKVLPQLQPVADAGGFGAEWSEMITEKTGAAAAAADAAARAAYAARAAAAAAANAARAAADAARAAADAAYADAAARAAYAARAAAYAAAYAAADFWVKADPISCLKQMIEVTE